MKCSYCYYLKEDKGPLHIDYDLLEKYIADYLSNNQGPNIYFVWHGGEPSLAGIDFFKKAVELQKKHNVHNYDIWNSLQTNGYLIDDEWVEFLRNNHFDVGLSIDGYKQLHDAQRRTAGGEKTFDRVYENGKKLIAAGINVDLLCTVTNEASKHPKEIYESLKSLNSGWIQFIPIVNYDNGKASDDSVTPEGYGRFLCDIFDLWYPDRHEVNIQLFSETMLQMTGKPANVCYLNEYCGLAMAVEKDGNVYSCDHFVRKDYLLGNIRESSMLDLVNSEKQLDFGRAKKDKLAIKCQSCPYLRLCNGGCLKDRFLKQEKGHDLSYLCEGLRMYYEHCIPGFVEFFKELRNSK